MKPRLSLVTALLCLAMMIAGVRAGSAQQVQPLEPEWLLRMYEDGWQKVQEGVLQRDAGEGDLETFSYGAEGLQWVVEGYEQQLSALEERFYASPSEELAQVTYQLRGHLDQLNGELLAAGSTESFEGEALETCSFSYDAYAEAGSQVSPRGVTATAWATWTNTCNYLGSTFAYAFANAIDGATQTTKTQVNPPVHTEAATLNSSAIASANGSMDCRSEAQAEVRVPALSIVYQTPLKQQFGCPAGVTASISGPSVATTDYYTSSCTNVTWAASATGGTPGYTYEWYIGTSFEGSGSTLTKNYCATNAPVTVKVVASDGNGWTSNATFTTNVQHTGPLVATVSGPSSAATNSTTPCVDVTWTASATGAHPGYTYSWYLGTGTTVQGTGSTFTKSYCSTTASVTAKVVARDVDGHTADATKTTSITHTSNPLTASITGQGLARLNTPGGCKSLTWTANVAGGTPGYTYSWYIGKTMTFQGTGSTLTKTFCGGQAVNVKLTVRDSNSPVQTKDATFTTNLLEPVSDDCSFDPHGNWVCQ